MNVNENYAFAELEDGSLLLEDVLTPYGNAERIYLGSGGIYLVMSDCNEPSALYAYFRNLLGVTRVRSYFVGKGEYLPSSDSFGDEMTSDELLDVIYDYLHKPPHQYSSATLERMSNTLLKSDARVRGCYTDAEGTVYLFRHGEFRRASDIDSEWVFQLCLYGGVFGLHRLALGKWFTGLLYAFTCGFFLLGWVCDLVQLFFGFQKDKHKHLVQPLTERSSKLRLLPFGILVSLVALVGYLQVFHMATEALSSFMLTGSSSFAALLQMLFRDYIPH